jgi:hypothetical protein
MTSETDTDFLKQLYHYPYIKHFIFIETRSIAPRSPHKIYKKIIMTLVNALLVLGVTAAIVSC